jgi:hypothetical protein
MSTQVENYQNGVSLDGAESASPADPFSGDPKDFNYFAVLFYLLLSSMTIREGTVVTQAKQISENAALQEYLNKKNGDINFSILPPDAKTVTIDRIQQINQQKAAMRQVLQNALIIQRQNGQVMMTQASTNVNIMQQDASENSGWLQTLNTIFQVIDQMNGR